MKTLRPLARALQRSLGIAVLRRGIAWMACALLLLLLGGLLAQGSAQAVVIRLGFAVGALSALPAFLLWPIPGERLLARLRRLDEDTVFEAYLEARPGAARDLLQRLAAERSAALLLRKLPKEPVMEGLRWLCAAALVCLVLAEGAFLLVRGRPLALGLERPEASSGGRRLEERDFSDFASEDPAARLERRRKLQAWKQGDGPIQGSPGPARAGTSTPGRAPQVAAGPLGGKEGPANTSLAERTSGERGAGDAPGGAPGQGQAPGGGRGPGKPALPGTQGAGRRDQERGGAEAGIPSTSRGRGYDHTPDTRIPSPLLDYRARFEARYAERTGTHFAAGERMGAGELRGYQRRYFESFALNAEVGVAEDPYLAELKRAWAARKGGLR